jgi:hypothetical protein
MMISTKEEKLIDFEDILYNSFHKKPATRKAVLTVAGLMAKVTNDFFPFTITKEDLKKIVDRLECRMDFKVYAKIKL